MSGLLRCLSRRLHLRCLGPLVLICFMLSVFYLALTPVEQDDTQMFNVRAAVPFVNASALTHESGHHLGIIIPFRDVWNELMIFVPHMHAFLNRQHIKHTIYAINQVDILRFNRASLINVGFIQALDDGCDYIAMHDVDLLPLNNDLSYAYPGRGPFHIAAPEFHPKYHYDDFVGGILLLTTEHYKQVNGLSNKYWGWGLEDDEFRARLKEQKLQVYRPTGITTGNRTLLHIHDSKERKRDYKRYGNQKQQSKRRDRITGVDSVQYTIISTNNLTIEDAPVQMLNVNLYCDLDFTPYCITPEQLQLYEGGSLTRAHGYLSKKPR